MQNSTLYPPEFNSSELRDFLAQYFLHQSDNTGYRWFTRESIVIDYSKRQIAFHLSPEQSSWGTKDFDQRVLADSDFNNSNFGFSPGFEFEQKMFDGRITQEEHVKALGYRNPEIGGKIAITETSLYIDSIGEIYIAIPLAIPAETYGLSGKLTGSYLHGGSSVLNTGKVRNLIDPRKGNREGNKLFELQKANPRDKIIKGIDDFHFGEWKVIFQLPSGKYSKMDNVHIGRANDGAFEIISSHLFRSYEDLVSNYHIKENLGFDRPVSLVRLSDLLTCADGEVLKLQKLFFQNQSISVDQLPDEYRNSIRITEDGNIGIHDFGRTPPLRFFEGKIKTLLFTDHFRRVVSQMMDDGNNGNLVKIGFESESEFSSKYNIPINQNTFSFDVNIPSDYILILSSIPGLTDKERDNIIQFIQQNNFLGSQQVKMKPDFVLETSELGVFIEYKSSRGALQHQQSKNQGIKAAIIQIFGNIKLNYNVIVGGGYGIDDTQLYGGRVRKISETYLSNIVGNNTDNFMKFFI